MKASRDEVYTAIDTERNYQEERWPFHKHSATEFLVFINHYVSKAMACASTENHNDNVLDGLRKIAALAVAAMEEHGAPPRITKPVTLP
jgi:hypothetical protein